MANNNDNSQQITKSMSMINPPNKQRSVSTYSRYGHKPLVENAADINRIQLKKTGSVGSKSIAPSASQSGTVNFRAVLRRTVVSNEAAHPHASQSSAGTMDWKSQMRKKRTPSTSVSMPPKDV